MVRDEAQGHHGHAGDALARQLLDDVADVRFEPRDLRGPGAGLVHELPLHPVHGLAHLLHDPARGRKVLRHVGGVPLEAHPLGAGRVGVRHGHGVGGEQHAHGSVSTLAQGEQRVPQLGGVRAQEALGVVVLPDLLHVQLVLQPRLLQAHAVVLPVLAAAGVPGVRARGEHQQVPVPALVALAQNVRHVRVPVAVGEQHGQLHTTTPQLGLERIAQRPVLGVDGAHAAVRTVVGGHLLEPLVRDAAAARDVAQERDDVLLTLRPAEGGEDQGVEAVRRVGALGTQGIGLSGVSHLSQAPRQSRGW